MKSRFLLPAAMLVATSFGASACASNDDADDELFAADRCDEEGVSCMAYGRKNHQGRPPAYELGLGTRAVTFTTVYQGHEGVEPVDVEFNARSPREMWVVNYVTSHVTVVRNPGTSQAEVIERRDPAYSHYMFQPPAIAFGTPHAQWGQQFATCGDNDAFGRYFMGPTLYSAELNIFGYQTQGGLGTHLDMLHSTAYCRGIAWAGEGNKYWTFNAHNGAIDFYDFAQDHGPGNNDHSDGIIRRFWTNQVSGVDGVMSHVSVNSDDQKVYVADTGNKRILVLDPTEAQPVAPMPGAEIIAERRFFEAPVHVLVPPGTLAAPSGIEASGGLAFVTDAETSKIHAFSLVDGELVKTLDTGLPPGSLAGLNFGPEGKIYFVDRLQSRVIRIDP
jgi:hypothetical protein